ncbi:MAG TPA: HPF/RaiA family ribosome-associated protein [Beijerinckiaceae bacterium]|nr:HPF/RaiA family ribosome-associated protein [Beijerinckiaceae bacterium]
MQIQVNTDDNVAGRDALTRRIETEVGNVVGRFAEQITRLEIHLGDHNAGKSGAQDKRCLIEARLAGRRPEAVSHEADTLEAAWTGAARKLRRSLESTLGRLGDHKGAASIRKDGI